MHLFRGIHHLEIGREAAHDLQRLLGRQVLDESCQLFAGLLVALTPAYRALPRVLDEVEQIVAALFPDEVADHRAERAHVVAQGLVLVLEDDVLAAQVLVNTGSHGWVSVGGLVAEVLVLRWQVYVDTVARFVSIEVADDVKRGHCGISCSLLSTK